MKKFLNIFWIASIFTYASASTAEEQTAKKIEVNDSSVVEIAKLSEAFGHLIGKNLQNIGVKFDIAQVIKGLQDASSGKQSPMSEVECIQAITAVQEKIFKEQSVENLKKADTFLQDNAKTKGVVSLESGKVQYRIEKEGKGAAVEEHFSPMIRYTGKFLDGSVFSTSKEEEKIYLEEIIPGLRAGLVGMKEGEKRIVYIHPEMAYGTNGYLPPNSLLTFEVDVIQANAPTKEESDAPTTATGKNDSKKALPEIAEGETHIR
ncbi:MAG TPA: FKBP-type peptidyl-prolyl cis-trans isomerase N-terminal domain-containing protein [Rhabdochlamydiaceae bacterium]|jgi:peptidylprolyl isomerase